MKELLYVCYIKKNNRNKENFESNENVTLYGLTNYQGPPYSYGIGKYDSSNQPDGIVGTPGNIPADNLRSLQVPSGLKVTLFQNSLNNPGNSVTFFTNVPDLGPIKDFTDTGFKWENNMSSFVVSQCPTNSVTLFPKVQFGGLATSYTAGSYDNAAGTFGSSIDGLGSVSANNIYSIKIPVGMKVLLYSLGGFNGETTTLTSDVADLSLIKYYGNASIGWNNISSFRVIVIPPPPSTPSNFKFSNQTPTGFTINWDGGNNAATSYTYTINNSTASPSPDNGVSNQTASFSGLTGGQPYTINITASNMSGNSTGTASITLPSPAPINLSNFQFSNQTATGFTVTWNGGIFATSYTYSLNSIPTTADPDNGVSGKNATFNGLNGGETYNIVITAQNISGRTSGNTSITLPVPTPTAPSNFIFSNQTTTSFTISWTGGTYATAYTYSINGAISPPSTDNGVASKTAIFTGLKSGIMYTITVTAINSTGKTDGNSSITLSASNNSSNYSSGSPTLIPGQTQGPSISPSPLSGTGNTGNNNTGTNNTGTNNTGSNNMLYIIIGLVVLVFGIAFFAMNTSGEEGGGENND